MIKRTKKTYLPKKEILDKYADVLIKFALNGNKGIKKGDVVYVAIPECAKAFLPSLQKSILTAGGHPIIRYLPNDLAKQFFDIASDEQIRFMTPKILKATVDEIDHYVSIISEFNPHEMKSVDPKKMMMAQVARKPFREWMDEKEDKGKLTWTLGLFPTEKMAKEANMTLQEYWSQVIKGCFLDSKDPIAEWKKTNTAIKKVIQKLNKLEIKTIHVESKNIDLTISLGAKRRWLGGTGHNIPSFEIYTSPDWRGTNGYIRFTEPLYRYGSLIENVYLEFKDGIVTKATATKGEKLLKEMIAQENANKIGEFSLTDSRFSQITKFMAETLYDENVGGTFGNTHIALGNAYKDAFTGNVAKTTKAQWKKLGFNESIVHTDIVSTDNRKVTAILKDGKQKVIYKNGMFTV